MREKEREGKVCGSEEGAWEGEEEDKSVQQDYQGSEAVTSHGEQQVPEHL